MCIHIIIRRILKSQEYKKNLYHNATTSPPYKRTQRKPPWYSKTDFARLATPAV